MSVYIPPHANARSAVQKLADQITETAQQHPDAVLIILGDFNKANLSRELPKYRQHITCPTRDSNILDLCYTAIKDAYHSVPRAALGLSDHCLVHLIIGGDEIHSRLSSLNGWMSNWCPQNNIGFIDNWTSFLGQT